MKKSRLDQVIAFIGMLLLASGLFLVKTLDNPQGFMLVLPYILEGVGCGAFGFGMGNIVSRRATPNDPIIKRQMEIETNDERNIAIENRAKTKAFNLMTHVFSALMLTFALMGVDMIVVLLLVFAYLFVHGYEIYCRSKYDKEM